MTDKPRLVFEIYIRTTPDRLWQAITDGSITERYYFGTRVDSSWQQNAAYVHRTPDGGSMIQGTILEVDPPRRLVQTFQPQWEGSGQATSRVTWEIEAAGAACKLLLIHDELEADHSQGFLTGWSQILSGLKTLLETGDPLVIGS